MPKTVLVLEAGGMRNAFLSGVLSGLRDHGLDLAARVDAAYACSSAAATAAFLLSRQIDLTFDVWFRLTSGKAFGLASWYRTGRIGNIDFVIDEASAELAVERVYAGRAKLIVNVVKEDDGLPVYLEARSNLRTLLKATSALPYICRPMHVDGVGLCLDGGLADPLPFLRAVSDGAERVIVISNRPKGFAIPRWHRMVPSLLLGGRRPVLAAYQTMPVFYEKTWELIDAASREGWCHVIRPSGHLPAHRFCRDKKQITATIACGIKVAQDHVRGLKKFLGP